MSKFATVVELYRMLGKPEYDGRAFVSTVDLSKEIISLISQINDKSFPLGRFEDIVIDGNPIDEDSLSTITGQSISFTYITPKQGTMRFYENITDFIGANSLKKGDMPTDYYIIDIDFSPYDNIENGSISSINNVCFMIKSLAELAHFHDIKGQSDNYKLVFVKNSDSKSTSIVLETSFTSEVLSLPCLDISVLSELLLTESKTFPYYSEKIGTFRNTLVEFISDNNYTFLDLVKKWSDFVDLFNNNLSTYMSGFSFHKSRKEIAEAESEFAEKISKIINELTGKILSIPIAIVASLGILKSNSHDEILLFLVGIAFTSLFTFLILKNQRQQLSRVVHAKDIVFNPFLSGNNSYPKELSDDISIAIYELEKNQVSCERTIYFFMFTSWIPTAIAVGIYISKISVS